MVYRRLRLPVWLAVVAFFAIFVIGSIAGPAVLPDVQHAFRIVTPNFAEVITQDVTTQIARSLHMTETGGVLISDVLYSPLRPGDVILSINGKRVCCQRELNDELALVKPGDTFYLEILRDGEIQTVTVQREMETPPPPVVLQGTVDIRGITVASLSNQHGVIVTDVLIGTPASDAGLKRGDIILQVDGHLVHSADEFLQFMRQLNNRSATFDVLHLNSRVDIFVIPA
jgi:serine protease Do